MIGEFTCGQRRFFEPGENFQELRVLGVKGSWGNPRNWGHWSLLGGWVEAQDTGRASPHANIMDSFQVRGSRTRKEHIPRYRFPSVWSAEALVCCYCAIRKEGKKEKASPAGVNIWTNPGLH